MPLIHTGRPWRTIYWIYTIPFAPYDYARGIWPNVRSPLVWDPSAVYTYLTSSILFVLVALVPDFAVLRDRTGDSKTRGLEPPYLHDPGHGLAGQPAPVEAANHRRRPAFGADPAGVRLGALDSVLGLRYGRVGQDLALDHFRPLLRGGRGPLRRLRRGLRDDHPALHLRLAELHPPRAHRRPGDGCSSWWRRAGSTSS